LSVMIVGPYFVVYMRKELHFEYWQITVGLFVMILVKAAILPFIGRLAKRIGPGRLLWIGAIVTMPMAALWAVDDSFIWIVVVQTLAAVGWACWETSTFLLIFDIIPAERRTSVLTVYQFVRAAAFLVGSLIGAAILELFGVGPTGYIALFVISSLMRFITLFMLASLEPTGLQLRDRTRKRVPASTRPIELERSEPGALLGDVGLVEFLVRFGEVDDALDQADEGWDRTENAQ
jgi:MFS family permease